MPGNLTTADWLLQRLERMGAFALASTRGRLAVLPALLIFVRAPADLPLAVLPQRATNIIAGAISLHRSIRTGAIGKPTLSRARTLNAMRGGAYVVGSQASISLCTNLNGTRCLPWPGRCRTLCSPVPKSAVAPRRAFSARSTW